MSQDGADDSEIVASGDALRTVAGWLGVADVDVVLEKEGLNPEYEQGRTQGLGLGAKFLPHHKAVALTSRVEHRLASKLRRTAERQAAAAHATTATPGGRSALHHGFGAPPAVQHGRAHGRWQDHAAAQRQHQQQEQSAAAGQEEEDSEEEGRGKAFSKGKAAARKPAAFSRSDLLKAGEAAHGKKRKRKGGGGGGAVAGP